MVAEWGVGLTSYTSQPTPKCPSDGLTAPRGCSRKKVGIGAERSQSIRSAQRALLESSSFAAAAAAADDDDDGFDWCDDDDDDYYYYKCHYYYYYYY